MKKTASARCSILKRLPMKIKGNMLVVVMRAIIISSLLFCIVLTSNCQPKVTNQLTTKEYSVYIAVIGERPENLVVVDESGVDVFGEVSSGKLPELLPGIFTDTIDDWVMKNREPLVVPNNFPFKAGYKVISIEEESKAIPTADQRYIATRVGFSKDGKQAMVRFYYACGPLCGDGAFYLLNNANGVWKVERESEHWRS